MMGMEEHDVQLKQIVEEADPSFNELVDGYLPFEDAYVAATTAGEVPVEGTTTTLFPRAASLVCASAR
jgi:hypothetical protein